MAIRVKVNRSPSVSGARLPAIVFSNATRIGLIRSCSKSSVGGLFVVGESAMPVSIVVTAVTARSER